MVRVTSKLTPEDVAWLERRLSDAIEPITPRPEFVRRAKQELMDSPIMRPLPAWVRRGVLVAALLSVVSLVTMLFYLWRRR